MDNQNSKYNMHEDLIFWQVPEHEKHERSRTWYIIACVLGVAMLVFSYFSANFLFAVIIILAAIVIIIHDGIDPVMIKISINDEGVSVGKRFYDYDDFENFSILYKPKHGVKNLYFEYKSPIKPRLSIPLDNMNPLIIREILLRYLSEDLERTDQPTSEGLAKLLKL